MVGHINLLLGLATLLSSTSASTMSARTKRAIDPVLRCEPEVLGLVTDPTLNRDSCGSVRFQSRDFWTCRDTQQLTADGQPKLQVVSSSASWSEYSWDGSPYIQALPPDGGSEGLLMSGRNNKQPFFPLQDYQCSDNTAGQCLDSSRYAIWPDSPPVVTGGKNFGIITAYLWIKNAKIQSDFSTDTPDPSTSLYKITYDPITWDKDALPTVELVDGNFWAEGQIPYGVYGRILRDNTLYLYGQSSHGNVNLARVPASQVEDKSAYEYYVDGAWLTTPPPTLLLSIPNASAGGQGTYYYSEYWGSYVWIGQAAISTSPDFYITTAPSPEGPWQQPKFFYSAEKGSGVFSGYSLQAHPDMVPSGSNEIYLTYTKADSDGSGGEGGYYQTRYSTPLIKVQWA